MIKTGANISSGFSKYTKSKHSIPIFYSDLFNCSYKKDGCIQCCSTTSDSFKLPSLINFLINFSLLFYFFK